MSGGVLPLLEGRVPGHRSEVGVLLWPVPRQRGPPVEELSLARDRVGTANAAIAREGGEGAIGDRTRRLAASLYTHAGRPSRRDAGWY
jgi:hypothetical protein